MTKNDDLMAKAQDTDVSTLMKPAAPETAIAPAPETPEKNKSKSPVLPVLVSFLVLILFAAAGAYFYLANKPAMPQTGTLPPVTGRPTEAPAPLFLTVTSPTAQTKTVNGEILVSGTTLPNHTVMILTDADETSVESDTSGLFETSVYLGDKGGFLKITVYSETGEEKSETLSVTGGAS